MTKAQVSELLALMSVAWPKFESDDAKIALWHEMFQDVDFRVASAALKRLMATSPYPPSIYDLRKQVCEVHYPDDLDPATAWGLVADAVRRHGWYESQRGMESLPEKVRRVVQMMGWQEICEGQPEINRAQFMRMYETVRKREAEQALLPDGLRKKIQQLGEGRIHALQAGAEAS